MRQLGDLHRGHEVLRAGLQAILESPKDHGRVELIVRRPAVDEREVLDEATLTPAEGLVGDTWAERGSKSTEDGSANPECQVTVMSSRLASLVAGDDDRRQLAGDQLLVDLDLSRANLPPGTRLEVGSAVLQVSSKAHTGCAKFAARFGREALRFVNSPTGSELNLRGLNTKVVVAGTVRTGDRVRKLHPGELPPREGVSRSG